MATILKGGGGVTPLVGGDTDPRVKLAGGPARSVDLASFGDAAPVSVDPSLVSWGYSTVTPLTGNATVTLNGVTNQAVILYFRATVISSGLTWNSRPAESPQISPHSRDVSLNQATYGNQTYDKIEYKLLDGGLGVLVDWTVITGATLVIPLPGADPGVGGGPL